MKWSKLVNFILVITITLLIILFALFFIYVYEDYTKEKTVTKYIDISEHQEEIKPVKVSQNKDETIILEMEPIRTQTQENNNLEDIENTTNKFYYNQLDQYSKLIYDSLYNQKEKLKTGNSTITLPKKISEISEQYETSNMEAIFTVAINAFEYDNPDVFYIDESKLILFYERNSLGDYKAYIKCDNQYSTYLTNGFNNIQDVEYAQSKIDETVKEIQEDMQGLDGNYQKIKYVHDWIVENIEYDETLNLTNRSNIYGAFVEKEVTCGGYAKAFKYLIDRLNIPCIIIQGSATTEEKTENHAWNYIELNKKWYGVDCTWDDPIIIGSNSNKTSKKYYTYFLKGQGEFIKHKQFESFYGTNLKLSYPELSNSDFIS